MTWYALPCVGLLAMAGSGCAGTRESRAQSPTARQVQSAQQQSEQALEKAAEAQRRASEQGERVAEAQREVVDAQRRLGEAQERLRQEQAKAEQLQHEALQATRESSREAQEAQQQASQALTRQGEYVDKGQQTFSGQVTRATSDELVVTPPTGQPMTFKVNDRTRVQIDGRQSSAAEIQQGGDARVAYQVSGTEPTAVVVQVITGRMPAAVPGQASPGQGSPGSSSDPAGTLPSEPSRPPQER